MKKFNIFFALAIITMFTWKCANEQPFGEQSVDKNIDFKIYSFRPEQISYVTSSVEELSKKHWKSHASKESKTTFWFDTSNVVGVQNASGDITYSFRLYFENGNPNSIFNIVAVEKIDGEATKPFVMEYEYDDVRSPERKRIAIRFYSLNKMIDRIGSITNKSDEWENVPLDTCGELSEQTSSINSIQQSSWSSTGGNSEGGYHDSGNYNRYNSYGSYYTIPYGGDNAPEGGGGDRGEVEVGQGCFCLTQPVNAQKGEN